MTNQFDPVLVNLIRRVHPQLVAHSILGVQPMNTFSNNFLWDTFNVGKYRDLRQTLKMNKEKYKTFLRLNNRKRKVPINDFYHAKYPYVDADYNKSWAAIHEWCHEFIGEYRYVWFGERFFFENEHDRLMFILAGWAS